MAVTPAIPDVQRARRLPAPLSEIHTLRPGMPLWSATAEGIIDRLRKDPDDSLSLIIFYEKNRRELELSALRWFGRGEQSKKAVVNILVAVARRAREFDSQTTSPSDWIRNTVDAEGRRLHGIVSRQLGRRHETTTSRIG
jgi:hypothetical protein